MNPIVQEILALLERHNASIHSSCQAGCELEIWVDGEQVGEFCCHIPEHAGNFGLPR